MSACTNVPVTGNYETGTFGKLRCSRPSPYVPSNGFAMEDAGFVPTYVIQQVAGFAQTYSPTKEAATTKVSRTFGHVRCLVQVSGTMTQTTCIDRQGHIVSWLVQNGSVISSRSTLTSINHHPTDGDFTTLLRPTTSLVLPAV